MTNCPRLVELPPPPPNKTGWPWTTEDIPSNSIDSSAYPKVTIVTPSYNQAQFLEETIRSVLLQDYPNLEYIVIDGGSKDGSVDIIRKYEPWIAYWVSEVDKGQADAINKGFKKATGEFLGWLNSDDYLYPGAIAKMAKELENHPDVSFVYGDIDQGSENNKSRLYGKNSTIDQMLKNYTVPIPQQGSMWRHTVISDIGGLDPRWNFVLDREFFLRVATKYNLKYITGVIAFFRHHLDSKSVSRAQAKHWIQELPIMYNDFFENNYDNNTKSKKLKHRALSMVYLHCASISLKTGHSNKALLFLVKAFKEYLMFLFFWIFPQKKTGL